MSWRSRSRYNCKDCSSCSKPPNPIKCPQENTVSTMVISYSTNVTNSLYRRAQSTMSSTKSFPRSWFTKQRLLVRHDHQKSMEWEKLRWRAGQEFKQDATHAPQPIPTSLRPKSITGYLSTRIISPNAVRHPASSSAVLWAIKNKQTKLIAYFLLSFTRL